MRKMLRARITLLQREMRMRQTGNLVIGRTGQMTMRIGNRWDGEPLRLLGTTPNPTDEYSTLEDVDEDAVEGPGLRTFKVNFADRAETKNALKEHLYRLLEEETGRSLPWGTLPGIRPTKIPMQLLDEGKSEREVADYMKKTYLASDEKIDLSIAIVERERALLSKLDYKKGYSLYIGIPFCPSTCLYCSFTSYPLASWRNQVDAYLDALEKELDYVAAKNYHKKLNSIYIGGGTPTTLEPYQLDRLIRKIRCSFDLSHCI